jgi:hypothetical protein
MNNYAAIVTQNLRQLFETRPADLASLLPATAVADGFEFAAFGYRCRIAPGGIFLDGRPESGVLGVLVSLYALNANQGSIQVEPLQSFKDLPGSMPYADAFTTHTEIPLIARLQGIEASEARILTALDGAPYEAGDFAYLLRPLPKVALVYVFYRPDEEFPASVTCLFSCNARNFLPLDALADTGEYTSRRILDLAAN